MPEELLLVVVVAFAVVVVLVPAALVVVVAVEEPLEVMGLLSPVVKSNSGMVRVPTFQVIPPSGVDMVASAPPPRPKVST